MNKSKTYKYLVKNNGLYINIDIGNDEVIYYVKELIEVKKGDKIILQIIRKKE